MSYFTEKLVFDAPVDYHDTPSSSIWDDRSKSILARNSGDEKIAGILLRIGNNPIVRDLRKLLELSGTAIPAEIDVLFNEKDIYSIVHCIGAIREEGDADIDELQYHARVRNFTDAQTIDLLPATRFREAFRANISIQGAMTANGSLAAEVPEDLTKTLLPKYLSLGAGMQIQLSSNASFVGKFTFAVYYPVVMSMGIASDSVSWILNPDENQTPLLGDQVLLQTIAVPKGTKSIEYEVFGRVVVDRGIWWKAETKETSKYTITVPLI